MSKTVPYREVANTDWNVWETDEGRYTNEQVQRAILLDIRAELKRLNRTLACPRFVAIPSKLDDIVKNTKRKKRRPVRAKPQLRVVNK